MILFGKSTKADFEHLTEELLLDVLEGVPQFSIAANDLSAGLTANQILTEKTQVVSSKGEFKRALQENSLSIYNLIVTTRDGQKFASDFIVQ